MSQITSKDRISNNSQVQLPCPQPPRRKPLSNASIPLTDFTDNSMQSAIQKSLKRQAAIQSRKKAIQNESPTRKKVTIMKFLGELAQSNKS